MTTKVHVVTDGLGSPLRFLLSRGNTSDIRMAQHLLEPFDLSGKWILADKGYDSDKFADCIKVHGGNSCHTKPQLSETPQKERLGAL